MVNRLKTIFESLNKMKAFPDRIAPRWFIMFLDVLIVITSLFIAFQLRFEFEVPQIEIDILKKTFPFFIAIRVGMLLIMKIYAGIIRYTGTEDAVRIIKTTLIGTVIIVVAGMLWNKLAGGNFILPTTIVILELILTSFLMILYRVGVKLVYLEASNPRRNKSNVLIYGAGEAGIITKRTLDRDAATKYEVIAFIDDDSSKVGKKLEGSPIYHRSKLASLLEKNEITELIVSMMNPEKQSKQEVLDICLNKGVRVMDVPPVRSWINGELSLNQLRPVKIEDLLERDIIQLDESSIREKVSNKTILITGAAGSIGSELVRQVVGYEPKRVILLEQAESPLYEFSIEMEKKFDASKMEIILGDVRNLDRMRKLFHELKPDMVFHAAAYKHVPLVEDNPSEGVLTNVQGTKVIADLSVEHGVRTFVLISTDKAVNPTNVMGASKRVAEMYIQALDSASKTEFITTRFGNVLGSNGSVIPLFKKQIEAGGPITVTHEKINRFFMTIPEACQLVLEASAMGKGGEIFVFDMGKAVRIIDLAKKMITLSGLEEGKDIEIKITGLRPGEKLFEEVLADEENTKPTHHKKILIADTRQVKLDYIQTEIDNLLHAFTEQNNDAMVKKLKQIVPEYRSENSIFEKLD